MLVDHTSAASSIGIRIALNSPGIDMWKTLPVTFAVAVAIVAPAGAQPNQRRASLRGDGNPNEGKCTIEVVVDGAADLEIRGDNGVLRNLSGRTPQWRRFECTARMPDSPIDFRVRGIDGRGKVQIVRDPRDGGIAIVRIEDPDSGAEGYTLDLIWRTGRDNYNSGTRNSATGIGDNSNQRRDTINQQQRMSPAFSTDQAVRACEEGVRQQAAARLGFREIQFRETSLDNGPGRDDWVVGSFASSNRGEIYRFSCSVDFTEGRVRSFQIDPAPADAYASGPGNAAMRACQNDVQARLERSGYDNVDFLSINMDNRQGRSDWVTGNAIGDRADRSYRFDFSCRMYLNNATVRSVNLTRK